MNVLTKLLMPLVAVLACLGLVACGGSSQPASDIVTPIAELDTPTPSSLPPTRAATPVSTLLPADATPQLVDEAVALTGFAYPIAGACLPTGDQLMPNAPREYRNGIHEGVDMYDSDNCTPITNGTHVLAAKDGVVIRADLGFVPMTPAELAMYLANPNTGDALDHFRGRQVWIQHETTAQGVIVTRYAHLSGIAPGIEVGTQVKQGQLIAFVGESGTPESITNPGHEYHLHFEIRVGDSYLGAGLPPADVRSLYQIAFSQ